MNTHTHRRLHHLSVALLLSHASHTIMSFNSRYEFFLRRPAATFVCKLCSSLGSEMDVGGIDLMKYTRVSPISEVWSGRHWHGGCAHSVSWHIVLLEDEELTTDRAHDRQLLLSQKYVMVIHQIIWITLSKKMNFDVSCCNSCSG